MISRRDVVTGAFLGGAGIGSSSQSHGSDEGAVRVLEDIKKLLEAAQNPCGSGTCAEVEQVRGQQRAFVKARGKFPDYIEVGIDVWERIHDWHIRNQAPLQVTRMLDGRYSMAFGFSTLILRPEMVGNFVGQPYDGR